MSDKFWTKLDVFFGHVLAMTMVICAWLIIVVVTLKVIWLVCTVKTGPNEYKKNYIYLNEYTMYVVEDITGTHTDPYHYKLYFHTDILPDVEVRS